MWIDTQDYVSVTGDNDECNNKFINFIKTKLFSLKEIQLATYDFDADRNISYGGFRMIYQAATVTFHASRGLDYFHKCVLTLSTRPDAVSRHTGGSWNSMNILFVCCSCCPKSMKFNNKCHPLFISMQIILLIQMTLLNLCGRYP